MTYRRGFSLIELMIVVAVIGIIAGIALPSLLGARIAANEAAAISNLRTICTACEQFRVGTVSPSYPANLAALGAAGNIDSALAAGSKTGYTFALTGATPNAAGGLTTYTCTAVPISNQTGNRSFFLDQTGVIRHRPGLAPATAADPPIE